MGVWSSGCVAHFSRADAHRGSHGRAVCWHKPAIQQQTVRHKNWHFTHPHVMPAVIQDQLRIILAAQLWGQHLCKLGGSSNSSTNISAECIHLLQGHDSGCKQLEGWRVDGWSALAAAARRPCT